MTVRFFAWRDPGTGELTLWRRHEAGHLVPWPKGARYGPQPPLPTGRSVREQLRSAKWAAEHVRPWAARVEADIEADPIAAAALFSAVEVRCQVCGRRLTDAVSRRAGIGPECRNNEASPTTEGDAR